MAATVLTREAILVVAGVPRTKGSLKCVGRNGHHQLVDDNPRARQWLDLVAARARELDLELDRGQPVGVELVATLPRPAAHYGTGANKLTLRGRAPRLPVRRQTGDVDKLARLVLDALQSAGVLADDAQVVELIARKAYPSSVGGWDGSTVPGIVVRLYPYETPDPDSWSPS
jgi:Holliday junction resolvase RusA-like endonuclease